MGAETEALMPHTKEGVERWELEEASRPSPGAEKGARSHSVSYFQLSHQEKINFCYCKLFRFAVICYGSPRDFRQGLICMHPEHRSLTQLKAERSSQQFMVSNAPGQDIC